MLNNPKVTENAEFNLNRKQDKSENQLQKAKWPSFEIDAVNGLISGACFIESPNQDERPAAEEIELIVIHGISLPPNQFGGSGVIELFTNQLNPAEDPYYETIQHLRVSAHVFIRRDGSVIQFVPFHKRAWHAGVSEFKGKARCNDFSIGIELEGADHIPYTASQYQSLARVIAGLWNTYPSLAAKQVVGHSDIAPGRKTDPGNYFMWPALAGLLENSVQTA